jgi:outer membrane PBP1 activator LpoA protein
LELAVILVSQINCEHLESCIMLNRGVTRLLVLVLACMLISCGTTPPKEPRQTRAVADSAGASIKNLLAQARASQSPLREQLTLQAAGQLIANKDFNRARKILMDMDAEPLSDNLFITHSMLSGRIAIHEGSYLLAHSILTAPRLEQQWQTMAPAAEIELRELRAQVFARLGDTLVSINERITLSTLLKDTKATDANAEQQNQENLWRSLTALSQAELSSLSEQESNDILRGWFSLALLSKDAQADLERQQAQLNAWQAQWPNHPASRNLPEDLKLLRSLIDNQPRQIALLLPLQGRMSKAGEAVRDGFFAAYYRALYEHNRAPVIRQYDSSDDVISAYEQAVAEGADLVIGPLDKEKVAELSLLPDIPVPLLTLNYTDSLPPQQLTKIYQFGLAVEDEARQVARQAFLEGHRHALVLVPAQEWSERSAKAFGDEWQKLGGSVVNNSQFVGSGDYSKVIKSAMLIEQSQERTQELQRLFGTNLQVQTRRRQDIDMIFLIADPVQARQIKPTLAFHYAGSLPVYATSQIYSGVRDEKADRDLNDIRFNAAPWLFDSSSSEKAINQHAQSSPVYSRLHALGVDAYRLYPRLAQLAQVPEMSFYGATGALRLLPNGRIEREQTWARFRNGVAQPLPVVVTNQLRE